MNDLGPIIVANVTSIGSGAQAILAARFTPTGTTMWTQRYNHLGCQGQVSSIRASESVKDITGAAAASVPLCTGQTINSPQMHEAIVVTGSFLPCNPNFIQVYGGSRRTFALKINERGLEVWRFAYPAFADPKTEDSGHDLVQLPTKNIVVVGRAVQQVSTGQRTNIYSFEIMPNGLLVCGSVHQNTKGYNTFARAVTLSPKQGNVVVAGPLDSLGQARRIMVTELGAGCSPFIWSNLYPKASPATVAEGIDQVTGNSPGYFVTANSVAFGTLDAFAMNTNATGQVPSCPVVGIKFDRMPATKLEKLTYCQQPLGDWVIVQIKSMPVQPSPKICITVVHHLTGAKEDLDNDIRIEMYPNPSAQSVKVEFLTEHADGMVMIADLMGNSVSQTPFDDTDSEVIISTEQLRSGIYVVQVQQSNGIIRSARLVKE